VPTIIGPNISDIATPYFVWGFHFKLSVEMIWDIELININLIAAQASSLCSWA
jgi:hypothetical protein